MAETNEVESSEWFKGHCYCEGIQFEVRSDLKPVTAAYCHCESCRRAHSAPMYQVVYLPEDAFKITSGEDLLKDFSKPSNIIIRSFCSNCGSRICNRLPDKPQLGVGFFPSLLIEEQQHSLPASFQASYHFLSHEATMELHKLDDGLPRN